ncbi:MAG: nitrite reductase [Flavobacteriales bacterium]|nr:nitrite reductase [Flavobacteriales bacterium]
MQSFRTELENPIVEKDILDLEKKIALFKDGKVDDDKFRSLRLARGIYGQRQPGVQMIRIKIPYGRLTSEQLIKIADISDEYASSTLHATTRQDIQIHYVSLDRTPELWHKLEQSKITIREACGNTVRNITASDKAGIDPEELFDVSPYAHQMFEYFLRNPVCQEMGRKFKIAFASSAKDTSLTLIHDLGFIPVLKGEKRGFKVMIGGGLGAQPFLALTAFEFLEEEKIIPFTEAALRYFDRYGERNRRNKARFKYLLQDVGLEEVMNQIEGEYPSLKNQEVWIDRNAVITAEPPKLNSVVTVRIKDREHYDNWVKTNVFEQKQEGFFGVFVRVPLGNISSDTARAFAKVVKEFAADDIRVTINQGYLLRYVTQEALSPLYEGLNNLGLAEPGFDSVADITACPGTDTCNLGISNSTATALELEKVIRSEFPELIHNRDIKIKISGCMNSCGQHGIANIGFHGSSMKHDGKVVPAMQVLLGGGTLGNGHGTVADKVIKLPSKRTPDMLRLVLKDYEENGLDGEYFNDYYLRLTTDYFYQLFKPLAELDSLNDSDYYDWGKEELYKPEIGMGECAGVIIDLVQTLFYDADEKLDWADQAIKQSRFADGIYHTYTAYVNGAKGLLLGENVRCNTQAGILQDFDKTFVETGKLQFEVSFTEAVLKMRSNKATEEFALSYFAAAESFLKTIKIFRDEQLKAEKNS